MTIHTERIARGWRDAAERYASSNAQIAIYLGIALLNLGAVIVTGGGIINLIVGLIAAAFATTGITLRTNSSHAADMESWAADSHDQAVQFWTEALGSDLVQQRKLAVDMLAYLGHPTTINPLQDPTHWRAEGLRIRLNAAAVQRKAALWQHENTRRTS